MARAGGSRFSRVWPLALGLLFLLAPVRPARAATATATEIRTLVEALVPELEATTGRTFLQVPRWQVQSRAQALAGIDEDADHVRDLVNNSLAVYVPRQQQILLISDNFTEIFQQRDDDEQLLMPVLYCTLAHELTHALQHQSGVLRTGDPSLIEGHANLVMYTVCTHPGARRMMGTLQLAPTLSTDAESASLFAYGHCARFLGRVQEVGGVEAVWKALWLPKPDEDLVIALSRAGLPAGWDSPAVLVAAAEQAGVDASWTINWGAAMPEDTLGALRLDQRWYAVPEALAGLRLEAQSGPDTVMLLAFALRFDGDAKSWVQRRRQQFRHGELFVFPLRSDSVASPTDLTWSSRRAFSMQSMLLRGTLGIDDTGRYNPWAYQELSVADGRLLVLGVSTGPGVSRKELKQAVGYLLAAGMSVDPVEGPLSPEAQAALHAWLDLPPPDVTSAPWNYWSDVAVAHADVEDWRACSEAIAHGLEAPAPSALPELLTIATGCALMSGDLDAAERMALTSEAGSVEAGLLLELAEKRLDEDLPERTLALLGKVQTTDPALVGWGNTLRLRALIALDRWSEVPKLDLTGIPARDLADLSADAVMEGQLAAAEWMVATTCPQLGSSEQAECEAMLTLIRAERKASRPRK